MIVRQVVTDLNEAKELAKLGLLLYHNGAENYEHLIHCPRSWEPSKIGVAIGRYFVQLEE